MTAPQPIRPVDELTPDEKAERERCLQAAAELLARVHIRKTA